MGGQVCLTLIEVLSGEIVQAQFIYVKIWSCKTAKVIEACGDLMSKCWSRLEAALASELSSSKNVKQFYIKECH